MQKYKILFIGLGTMGFNMATFLAKSKKYDLYIYNRTKNIQQKWLKKILLKYIILTQKLNLILLLLAER